MLRQLDFRVVHQIHDEVLLEGPEDLAEAATREVVRVMEDPLPFSLAARLVVDARTGSSWHEGKA